MKGDDTSHPESNLISHKIPLVSPFDLLIEKLKHKLGAAQFLEFFKQKFGQESQVKDIDKVNKIQLVSDSDHQINSSKTGIKPDLTNENDNFKLSTLETEPEKEFEKAKWIVLTTP